jgi:hypothetical protein
MYFNISNSPAFLCWTDAYMLRRFCLISAQANRRMCHTVTQINQLMHAPSICTISNTLCCFRPIDWDYHSIAISTATMESQHASPISLTTGYFFSKQGVADALTGM